MAEHVTRFSGQSFERMKQRILFWDIIKCVAMFLVVWGHCLQNMTTDASYFTRDLISECIISCHMALFMLVSGYFAYSSLFRSFQEVMSKRAIQILLPSVSWFVIIRSASLFASGQLFSWYGIRELTIGNLSSFWFLKALFMCYLIVMLGAKFYRVNKNLVIVYVAVLIVCGEWLNYSSTISMLPFFLCGLLLRRFENWIFTHSTAITSLAGIIWVVMLQVFDIADYSIYHQPFTLDTGGVISLLIRTSIGVTGSFFGLLLMRRIFEHNDTRIARFLADVGSMTLGIYCIQVIFAEVASKSVASYIDHLSRWSYDLVVTPIYAILVMVVCVTLISLITKNKFSRLLLLGEK